MLPNSIHCPFRECQNHTQQSSQTPVWLVLKAPAKRGQKENEEEKHPFFLELCWSFSIIWLIMAGSVTVTLEQRQRVLVPPASLCSTEV